MSRPSDSAFLDTELAVLTSPYRRRVLRAVSTRGPLAEEDLPTDALAADETGDDPETLKLELTHSHLPRLAAHGYIEWERDTGVIRRGPNFDDIEPRLGALVERESVSDDRS